MKLALNPNITKQYKSPSQKIRVATENKEAISFVLNKKIKNN